MKRLIFAVMFLLVSLAVFAQVPAQYKYFKGGVVIGFKFTNLDSAETVYSEYFDVSMIDNASPVYAWIMVDGSGAGDSLTLVTIEGRYPPLSGESVSYVKDYTLDTIGTATTSAYQTILGITDLKAVYSSTDTTDNVFYIPPVYTFPEWRIKIAVKDLTASMYDGVCRLYIYAKTNDAGLTPESIRGY